MGLGTEGGFQPDIPGTSIDIPYLRFLQCLVKTVPYTLVQAQKLEWNLISSRGTLALWEDKLAYWHIEARNLLSDSAFQ